METERLLQEFPPISTETWEAAIRADLNGADYEKKLVWQSPEGLSVKPYYRAEDMAGLTATDASRDGDWRIREEIDADDPAEASQAAQNAAAAGAEEIAFLNVILRDASDVRLLLAGIPPIPLHFENAGKPLIRLLLECSRAWRERFPISAAWNPLEDPDFAALVLGSAPAGFVPLMIRGEELEENGATAVQETGFLLAAGIAFLRDMQAREVQIDRAAGCVAFSFAIGSSFFFQIAKLRAFRALWSKVVQSFGGSEKTKARLYARTSRWNETIYDSHVNILRATTEAMSAVIGGADSICVAPFDECSKTPDEANRRLARNTQLILRHEAMLGRVADPGAGSYCLEVLTDSIAREGWKLMQRIEAAGGYRKACAAGSLDRALRESAMARKHSVTSRRRIFTGTTRYANPAERALDRIEPLRASPARRGAAEYERLRLRTERHATQTGKRPRVLLAEFGDARMRAARSKFAADFFACAGFDIDAQQLIAADRIATRDADLIVLCSSDGEYPAIARSLAERLKMLRRETPMVVAGNPESAEQLRAIGVADFVYAGCNPVEFLSELQRRLGIKA